MKDTDTQVTYFKQKLADYKKTLDEAINSYANEVKKASGTYGQYSGEIIAAYLEILRRGGKRIRGALTMAGYEMTGGHDEKMILKAAMAVEMVHAYILMIDDFQDQSETRRGGQAAHVMLANYHKKLKLTKDSKHFGESMAINAALIGNHAAQMIMANLDADDTLKVKALSILNRSMIVTGHGQINDGMNEILPAVTKDQVYKVMEWKTAYYTFLNPLHVGMILAGAECSDTDAISHYAKAAGRAFQISDDILGIFGSEPELGKSPMDDLREGKRTLLIVYALEHAGTSDKKFLLEQMANGLISAKDFARCKQILTKSGALDFSKGEAKKSVEQAISALNKIPAEWSPEVIKFLRGLVLYLMERKS